MKKISIIIVTYNSEKDIWGCLDSIYKKNDIGDSLEIIIVDNNSDNQKKKCNDIRKKYPEIKVIENTKNTGYGAGNNIGIKAAESETILIMNPDVRVYNMSFKGIYRSYETNPKLGILGFTQYETPKKRGRSFLPLFISTKYFSLLRFHLFFNKFNPNLFCFSGACFSFRKKALADFGFFDEEVFLYGEERYIHLKVLQGKVFKILYNPQYSYLHPMENREFNKEGVILVGPKFGVELDSLFEKANLGIGCLGCHRKEIKEVKSLKNIEYAARGMPMVYSEKNDDFDNKSYVIKVPDDETPIDIDYLIKSYKNMITQNITSQSIRESVSEKLSWDSQIYKLLMNIGI